MIVLDTSALIRFFTGDDLKKAEQVKKVLESEENLVIIDAVMLELAYTLMKVYGQTKLQVVSVLKFLLSRANIEVNAEMREGIELYEKENLSITDSLVIVWGKKGKILSFDEKLMKYSV